MVKIKNTMLSLAKGPRVDVSRPLMQRMERARQSLTKARHHSSTGGSCPARWGLRRTLWKAEKLKDMAEKLKDMAE